MLGKQTDVNEKDNYGGTPLHYASRNGHIEIVRELINYNAELQQGTRTNVNEKDNYGGTPLHYASRNGRIEIVRELINYNADVDEKDKNGWTPLHYASADGHIEIVRELINYCDLFITNCDGETALDLAKTDEVKQLIQNYIEIKEPGSD